MTMRWGILGCGDVARRRVANAIQQDGNSELLAACRRTPTALAAFCADFKVPRAYESVEALIADEEIDAVYIASPVSEHLPQTVASARQGKHVLVEKPMALSEAECSQMIDACHAAGVALGVAYYRRFYPVVKRMARAIADREIGSPLSISAVTGTPFTFTPRDDGYWRVVPERSGGGAMMDLGSHRVNLFLHLLGEIDHVAAYCDTLDADYGGDNCSSLLARFRDGPHGVVQCFFGTPIDRDEFTVVGTDGTMSAAPLNRGQLHFRTASRSWSEDHPPADNFNAPLIADFVAAVRDGRPPQVSGSEGRATNAVLERAYRHS